MDVRWTVKKVECWGIAGFELWCWKRLLRVPWTAKRSNQSILKGNRSWISIGRTDAEAPILWPLDVKKSLIRKDPDAGKDWRQKEGTKEDEMVGWHHWLDGHEFEQALGVGDGQGSLECCSPQGRKESDTTEWLNWNELKEYACPPFFYPGSFSESKWSSIKTYKLLIPCWWVEWVTC